ncbi:MAG: polysaccharide deacetylase family protein [Micromonosporaceae bacterium]|nr:polysaccharide deacetylase family protein [Micromonosporaceae bacterium]
MKAVLSRFLSRIPVFRTVLLAGFALLQILGVQGYLKYENLIANVSFSTLKEAYLPALTRAPQAPQEATFAEASAIPVLLYHGIIERPDGYNVLIKDFREQMFALKRAGYQAVSMDDYLAFCQGERKLPAGSFLLTFDDGRKDSYYPVDPIIKALGFHATMFVITGQSFRDGMDPRDYYLDRKELITMRDSGRWDIGAHTRDFHGLTDIDAAGAKGHLFSNFRWLPAMNRLETQPEFQARVEADLRGAREDLRREIGVDAATFAFPFGDYGQDTINHPGASQTLLAASRTIYAASFVQDRTAGTKATQNRPGSDLALSRRMEVYPDWTPENLLKMMTLGTPKWLPFRDSFGDLQGWQSTYGRLEYRGDSRMRLAAPVTGTSASTVLDGADGWTDYTYRVEFEPTAVLTNVALVARYQGESSYVACVLTPARVRVEQRFGNRTSVLSEVKFPKSARGGVRALTMSVTGNRVQCGGPRTAQARLAGNASAGLATGGIGARVWNPAAGAAILTMTSVDVAAA